MRRDLVCPDYWRPWLARHALVGWWEQLGRCWEQQELPQQSAIGTHASEARHGRHTPKSQTHQFPLLYTPSHSPSIPWPALSATALSAWRW